MTKIAINGFGRIGRMAFRAAAQRDDVEVVAVNDLLEPEHLAYLLRYDSVHGRFPLPVEVTSDRLLVGGKPVFLRESRTPEDCKWGQWDVDVVIESTGVFLSADKVKGHLAAGAKKVLVSAPTKDETPVFVYGVNTDKYRGEDVISAASCTTNCLAPIAKILSDRYGLRRGLMTTVHATTATQKVVDGPASKDWRFGRGILNNIIPASTGAAKAVTKVLPELKGKLTGTSFRVPVSDVSVVDLTCELDRPTSYEAICAAMKEESLGAYRGVLEYSEDELVSTDIRGSSAVSIFDAKAGMALDPTFVKLIAWYDNEWGYASKLLDLARLMAQR